jgi:hypothetical protein
MRQQSFGSNTHPRGSFAMTSATICALYIDDDKRPFDYNLEKVFTARVQDPVAFEWLVNILAGGLSSTYDNKRDHNMTSRETQQIHLPRRFMVNLQLKA